MKKTLLPALGLALALALGGCASRQPVEEVCCAKPEVVYVDKAVAECTRAVQRVTQVNPCTTCEKFPVSARYGNACVN